MLCSRALLVLHFLTAQISVGLFTAKETVNFGRKAVYCSDHQNKMFHRCETQRSRALSQVRIRATNVRHGEGNGTPLQYSCLENPMDGGAWKAAVHGVAEGRTQLSDFTFTFRFHALEKEVAPHSSVLAWRIPGTREPGGLPSMGSHRVGHDWSDLGGGGMSGLQNSSSGQLTIQWQWRAVSVQSVYIF